MSSLDSKTLERELVTLAAHLAAGMCRWLELVAEVDRRSEWYLQGARSSAHWLAWRCALDLRTAREHVSVARRLAELPLIRAAFASGELSYSKVRALARVASSETETELLALAAVMTAAQLERTVATYQRVSTEEGRHRPAGAGGRCAVPARAGGNGRRHLEPGGRFRGTASGASGVTNRKTRAVPPTMRRALRLRDQSCRFPGCENRRFLDAPHVHHWVKGGGDDVEQSAAALSSSPSPRP